MIIIYMMIKSQSWPWDGGCRGVRRQEAGTMWYEINDFYTRNDGSFYWQMTSLGLAGGQADSWAGRWPFILHASLGLNSRRPLCSEPKRLLTSSRKVHRFLNTNSSFWMRNGCADGVEEHEAVRAVQLQYGSDINAKSIIFSYKMCHL